MECWPISRQHFGCAIVGNLVIFYQCRECLEICANNWPAYGCAIIGILLFSIIVGHTLGYVPIQGVYDFLHC